MLPPIGPPCLDAPRLLFPAVLLVAGLLACSSGPDGATSSGGGGQGSTATNGGAPASGGASGQASSGNGLCGACQVKADCRGAGADCVRNDASGETFCGQDCTSAPCPAGYTCATIPSSQLPKQCVPATMTCTRTAGGAGAGGAGTAGAAGSAAGAGGSAATPTGDPSYLGPFCEGNPRHVIGLDPAGASAQPTIDEMRAYMLEATNHIRAMTNLPPLKLDDCLNQIADAAIADVAGGGSVHGYFQSNCLNAAHGFGKSCQCNWAQENYGAAGGSRYTWKDTIDVPLCGMMDEPKGQGHRSNIESAQWTRLGVGLRGSGSSWQWVQEFGR